MFRHLFPLMLLCSFALTVSAQSVSNPAKAEVAVGGVDILIQPGDQLEKLAKRYLVPGQYMANSLEVAAFNKLAPPYRLKPGTKLRLPVHLLATEAATAKWVSLVGDVKVGKEGQALSPATLGGTVTEGDLIAVGAGGHAALLLADASLIQLSAGTQLVIAEHRYMSQLKGTSISQAFAGLMRLLQGSVEARVNKASDRAAPLRIQTPTSVVGVRGTEFRVGTSGANHGLTRSEVIEGNVLAQLDPARAANLTGGFGVVLDAASSSVPAPVKLLGAPDLSNWPTQHQQLQMEYPALPTTQIVPNSENRAVSGYRIQVAPTLERRSTMKGSEAFSSILFERVFKAGEPIRIAGLPDGHYLVRARAIDPQGLEGFATTVYSVLRARPEALLVQTPATIKAIESASVELKWASTADTDTYIVEVVDEGGGVTLHNTPKSTLMLSQLKPGIYRWRVAAQSLVTQSRAAVFSELQIGTRERGQWTAPAQVVVTAQPASASAEPSADDKQALTVRWPDQKAARYDVQIASHKDFSDSQVLLTQSFDKPLAVLRQLQPGEYFLRYRAIEADGFVGGWSSASKVEVPIDWKKLLLFLGGIILLWP